MDESSPSTVVLKYTGRTATIRRITRGDFKSIGVDDQGDAEWNVADIPTKGQARVSEAAARALLAREPNNFKEVAEEERATVFKSKPESKRTRKATEEG